MLIDPNYGQAPIADRVASQTDHEDLVAFCEKMGGPLPKFLTMADLRKPWYEAPSFYELQYLTWQQTGQMYPAPAETLMLVLAKRFLLKRGAFKALREHVRGLHSAAMQAARRANGKLYLKDVEAIKAENGYVPALDEYRRMERQMFKEARRILRYHPETPLGLNVLKDIELFLVMFDRPVGGRTS